MEIQKYIPVIKKFSDAKIHQHLYTNGTLASEQSLRALGETGLNEIRFNLGASGCSDKVIENMRILRDEDFKFICEEQLPDGYKPGELVF